MNMHPILPGSTIAILGGGQLGKMTQAEAQRLGFKTIVWDNTCEAPALAGATRALVAPWDSTRLDEILREASVITTEWENVPVPLLSRLESLGMVVRPSSSVLAFAQSRSEEKRFASRIGAEPVPWAYIADSESMQAPSMYLPLLPAILKTDRNGYDGKNQLYIATLAELRAAVRHFAVPCVLEKRMPLDFEMSILVARNPRGDIRTSDIVRNVHRNGILAETTWRRDRRDVQHHPAAAWIAAEAAKALRLEGILAIEFFVSDGKLYFNEMAPRPHNSFHGTNEAAWTSQFEQHVRAICDMPLGSVEFHTAFRMVNLIGDDVSRYGHYMTAYPSSRVYIYGKGAPRDGRKMGHVTILDAKGT